MTRRVIAWRDRLAEWFRRRNSKGMSMAKDAKLMGDGSVPREKVAAALKAYGDQKEEMDSVRGEMGAEMKAFEDAGGDKKALKLAHQLGKKDKGEAQAFLRALEFYADVAGVFEQTDIEEFTETPTQHKPARSKPTLAAAGAVAH